MRAPYDEDVQRRGARPSVYRINPQREPDGSVSI